MRFKDLFAWGPPKELPRRERLPAGLRDVADIWGSGRTLSVGTIAPVAPLPVLTSEDSPIRVDWLPVQGVGDDAQGAHADGREPGRLGLTFAPGKQGAGIGTHGYWKRSLVLDMDRLRDEYKVDVLIPLLTPDEYKTLSIEAYAEEAAKRGILVLRYPIPDVTAPTSVEGVRCVVDFILSCVGLGMNVVVHCRGGHGRAGTIGACALVTAKGIGAKAAIELVREARDKRCVETWGQEEFVYSYAGEKLPSRGVGWADWSDDDWGRWSDSWSKIDKPGEKR